MIHGGRDQSHCPPALVKRGPIGNHFAVEREGARRRRPDRFEAKVGHTRPEGVSGKRFRESPASGDFGRSALQFVALSSSCAIVGSPSMRAPFNLAVFRVIALFEERGIHHESVNRPREGPVLRCTSRSPACGGGGFPSRPSICPRSRCTCPRSIPGAAAFNHRFSFGAKKFIVGGDDLPAEAFRGQINIFGEIH